MCKHITVSEARPVRHEVISASLAAEFANAACCLLPTICWENAYTLPALRG